MKQVAMGLCILGAAMSAQAAPDTRLEVGLDVGVAGFQGDVDSGEYLPAAGLHAWWWLNDRAALSLSASLATLRSEDDNDGFRTPLSAVSGRIVCLPFHKMAVDPYFTFGWEWATFEPEDSEDSGALPAYHDPLKDSETSSLVLPVGLGLRHELRPNLILTVEGLYHFSESDWLDDLEADWDWDNWVTVTAGLAWSFGTAREFDSDGDGIIDKLDKCPAQPEDKDGFQDADGCPDPDNDGDGILDVNDKCPNEKEDMDGFQDADGCPDPDNDGDGILDINDKCPNEPETVNGYQDQDGCPDKKPAVAVEQGKAIVLEGVNFDTGKATLKAESETPLNKVLSTLKDNPEIEVEIRGYTDNQGEPEMNRDLSQRRADTVKAWLVERGIAAGRVQTRGFGPDNPVADNGTPEGRAQNRRIEFFRLK